MDTKPENQSIVKGPTRTVLTEAARLLEKQSHIHMFTADGTRAHSHSFRVETMKKEISKLLSFVCFFDDNEIDVSAPNIGVSRMLLQSAMGGLRQVRVQGWIFEMCKNPARFEVFIIQMLEGLEYIEKLCVFDDDEKAV